MLKNRGKNKGDDKMSAVRKGTEYEREVIKMFRDNGYEVRDVMRTAKSHGTYDVIAVKRTEKNKKICFIALVQCKIKSESFTS